MMARLRSRLAHIKGARHVASHRGRDIVRIKGSGGTMSKNILCSFGVDVDAVAGWLGSYGGEDSSLDISRGLFAGEVGSPRLVKLFHKYGMKVTWFVPAHSSETFPDHIKLPLDPLHPIH